MVLKDLNKYTTIIVYDDETYGKRAFINGEFITYMEDGTAAVIRLLDKGQTISASKPIMETELHYNELFFNYTNRQIAQKLHLILSESVILTENQVLAIFNKEYEKI